MLQQTTTENKPQCEICNNKGYHVDVDNFGKLFVERCQNNKSPQAKAYCDMVNWEKIDPESREDQFKIKSKNLSNDLLDCLRVFIKDWSKIKQQKTHCDIVKNPDGRRIVRAIDEKQFTTLHLFTRNQVFQIISKEDRAKYTEKSELNGELVDIPIRREFLGWGNKTHFEISGPMLCDYDQEVFDALIKIWHEKFSAVGILIETSLSEIWRTIGNKSSMSLKNIQSLKRSLGRLYKVSIEAKSTEDKSFWGGGIIDDVCYKEFSNKKNHLVMINFNKNMIRPYLEGSYATLNHPIYQKLTPYSKKIYTFSMSHDSPERKMGLDKWRNPIGVSSSLSDKKFKEKFKFALNELKLEKVFSEDSHIDKKDFVYTRILDEAWLSKPMPSGSSSPVVF